MASTKKAGAARRLPIRQLPISKPAPDQAVTFAESRLVYLGGADLSFRDGLNRKRKVLRGVEFTVDVKTAEILLTTDPKVIEAGGWGSGETVSPPAPIAVPEAVPPAPEPVPEGGTDAPADDPAAVVTGEAGTPPTAYPSGAITLGDLPSAAKVLN